MKLIRTVRMCAQNLSLCCLMEKSSVELGAVLRTTGLASGQLLYFCGSTKVLIVFMYFYFRATALIMAANSLIAAGQKDYVTEYMWTGDNSKYNGGVIKYDLDYVVSGYSSNTCDLWEEIRDPDLFWNRATMKKAMIVGAEFAQAMGDSSSASAYTNAMQHINSTLYSAHYNGAFVQECASRTRDSAVIVGFNDAYDEADSMFAPTSLEVANTISSYNSMFCSQ